ncbi:hypothetical protein E4U42_000585 [Claviceps africana]|uniref:tripeptidyl-peptidase II n=1 Tax=Claviceps africana TaxID=83212 RepID=A0A8K0IZY6_9HYPO|nr:hypothetical protein E4U42_000585 [Claviceps africana]
MLISFFMTAWAFSGVAVAVSYLYTVEKVKVLPEGWKLLDEDPDPSTPIRISLALNQPLIWRLNSVILWNALLNEGESQYFREPDNYNMRLTFKWLESHNITTAKRDQDWIHVTTTVGEVNKLLYTRLRRYSYRGGKPLIRTTEYAVPPERSGSIDFVHPIANFMTPGHEVMAVPQYPPPTQQLQQQQGQQGRQSSHKRQQVACSPTTTPGCIHELYGIDYTTRDGRSSVQLAIAGFLEQWANYDDMRQNFADSRPDLAQAGYNFTVEPINGGENKQDAGTAGTEANLDIQYAMAVGFPVNVTYYSTRGRGEKLDDNGKPLPFESNDNEPYLEFFQHFAKKLDNELPHVISLSYADDEFTVPEAYAIRVCNEIGLLSLRGVSVLAASGDGGAMGSRNASCRSHDGRNRDMTISTFPASCPWVTSVGAVKNGQEPPEAAEFSAGGFSKIFQRPDWQRRAVNGYVKHLNGHLHGYYHRHMRATPDISVVGTLFHTIVNGQPVLVQGTSASTPVLAAMIALVNDVRLRRGKKPLGCINKRLYAFTFRHVLQDITTGQSLSCTFSDGREPGGWPATPGWDAVTGLGVPHNFKRFMEALMTDVNN